MTRLLDVEVVNLMSIKIQFSLDTLKWFTLKMKSELELLKIP
jgi:hypothetical protein